MPRISGVLNSLSLIFASLLRSSPWGKSSYWIFFTFIPLRHLKYNPCKLKLIVTSPKLVPLLFIPCRLVTSPFTQARNITSLPTFFFTSPSNSQIPGSTASLPKQLFRSKRKPNTSLLCFNRGCVCPDHFTWILTSYVSVLPASRMLQSSASLKRMMSVYNLTSLMPPPQAS